MCKCMYTYGDVSDVNGSNLLCSLLGAMFPLPRIIYAMASDGLIFEWMGKVNSRFHTPLMGTFSAGILTGSYFMTFLLFHNTLLIRRVFTLTAKCMKRNYNFRCTSCDI